MGKILLESGIIVLLVLMGISVFIPSSSNNVNDVIVDFESSIENEDEISDGEIENVEINEEDNCNFIAKINCKIGNIIVGSLNSMFELGMKIIRVIVN